MKLIRDVKEALLVTVSAISLILCCAVALKIGGDVFAGAPAPSHVNLELMSTGILFAISVVAGSIYLRRRDDVERLTDLLR